MKFFRVAIYLILVSGMSHANDNDENDTVMEILVVAKATGMCGAIKQMSAFQEATKMPGGDDFMHRFINTEAARLGKTLPEWLGQCKKAVAIYTELTNILEHEQ